MNELALPTDSEFLVQVIVYESFVELSLLVQPRLFNPPIYLHLIFEISSLKYPFLNLFQT